MALYFCLLFVLLSSLSASACVPCVHHSNSKASYFNKPLPLYSGACGYGSLALGFNGGNVAAGVASLYRNGSGCGGCFQIRCKDTRLCSRVGTRVILTDINTDNRTDFVLSSRAMMGMANKGMGPTILKLGAVDVEYKRVPCEYKSQNLSVRVEESSKKPSYLAVKFLYQGGQTEIVAVDIARTGSPMSWSYMTQNHGPIWDTNRVPVGPLQFRLVITAGYDGKWVWAKNVLPADWKVGSIYDSGVQISDIAKNGCSSCDGGAWL